MTIAAPTIAFQALISSTALNTNYGTIVTELNRASTIVDAATAAALASQVAKRDAKGGANFGLNGSVTTATLSALAPDASTYTFYGRMFTGGLGVRIQNQAGSSDLFTIAADGTTTATGFVGPLTGNATTATSATTAATATTATNATGLTAPIAFAAAIADYKLAPSVSAGQVTVSAGGQYGDSLGNAVGPLGAQPAVLPAQPSGTNIQYHFISLAPVTGAPVVTSSTGGATGGTLPSPNYPVGNAYVGKVTRRGATTNPGDIIAAGDITPALIGGGGGGSGGGGGGATDATVRAATLWLDGTNAALPNAVDSTSGTGNGFIHPKYIKNAATDTSLYDTFSTSVTGNIVGSAAAGTAASGLRLVVGTNAPPIVVALPSVTREIVATTDVQGSAPTPSVAAKYQVIADLRGTGPAFIPTLTAAGATLFSSETILFTIWWTGFAWDFASLFYPAFPNLSSGHFSLVRIPHQSYAGTNSNVGTGGAAAVMVGSSPYTVTIPADGMRGEVTFTGDWQQSASTITGMYALLFVDGTWYNSISLQNLQTVAGGQYYPFIFHAEITGLAAGSHTFQPGYLNTAAAGTFGVPIQNLRMWGTFSRS